MPRRIGTCRRDQFDSRPCRIRPITCQPRCKAEPGVGNLLPCSAMHALRENMRSSLSHRTSVRPDPDSFNAPHHIDAQRHRDGAPATARTRFTLQRQRLVPREVRKTCCSAKNGGRVKRGRARSHIRFFQPEACAWPCACRPWLSAWRARPQTCRQRNLPPRRAARRSLSSALHWPR
jgi:hypothetical protein